MATAVSPTDAELLERFVRRQDLTAFEALLRRHGPMVYQVCQRVLYQSQDAEDAFQATFVVLVKKAATISQPEMLGGWLHGVAQRIAMKARGKSAQRQAREQPLADCPVPDAGEAPAEATWSDLRPVLDEELNRLPEKYRAPLVLCYLEGKTNDQAAAQLGWSRGKVAGKLSRGRELLRGRLARRGLSLSSVALGALLLQQTAHAAPVPAALTGAVLQASAPGGLVSAKITALAEGGGQGPALLSIKGLGVLIAVALAGSAAYFMLNRGPEPVLAFQHFDGLAVPTNRAGEEYPRAFDEGNAGGPFASSIDGSDAVAGKSLRMRLTAGFLKAQFDPNELKRRGFTRDYVARPEAWRFDTYNRLRFWIKAPPAARPDGLVQFGVGTYISPVQGGTGRTAFFHLFQVAATGHWSQVVLNMHPHWRDGHGGPDVGHQPRPTGEAGVNYFDALQRFFLEARSAPASYPADYGLDEMEFVRETYPENDEQVYGITATYVPEASRVIVTWNRPSREDTVVHEVRYAFRNIHEIGWEAAQPAPGGNIKPTVRPDATGMHYDSSALPVQGQSLLYIALKPENARRFSQVTIRLTRN
ncbi:MAG: RNA polymerase sigma factor [Planctomycetia bacterium]|nr:RNA polymerase sigma factor [Planctomycetia bacterium]